MITDKDTDKDTGKDTGKDTDKDTDNLSIKHDLSNNEFEILQLMEQNPKITTRELSKEIGINQRNIKKNIDKLKIKNLIHRVGPARGGYWEVLGK